MKQAPTTLLSYNLNDGNWIVTALFYSPGNPDFNVKPSFVFHNLTGSGSGLARTICQLDSDNNVSVNAA